MNIDKIIEKYNKLSKSYNAVFPEHRNYKQLADWLLQLKRYQLLEAQGNLISLPCAVGDRVWEVNIERNLISEYLIKSITIYPFSVQFNWELKNGIYKNVVGFAGSDIGKTVFLTKSEAEAKLWELMTD